MPGINKQILAEEYGFSAAMLNSNPELKRLFKRAVKENWDPAKFIAHVRGTKWWKRTSESQRNAQLQEKADPATYRKQVDQQFARVRIMAREFGSQASPERLRKIAEQAYRNEWDDNQLRGILASTIRRSEAGLLEGQAGEWERQWREYARSMGVGYDGGWYRNQARAAVRGTQTPEDVLARIQKAAKSRFPHLSDRIAAGETVADIAEPYRQAAAELLERDPASISLNSDLIKRGLSQRDKKGKPTAMTLYEFEDFVRKDPRWGQTDNARRAADEVVHSLGQMFGKVV